MCIRDVGCVIPNSDFSQGGEKNLWPDCRWLRAAPCCVSAGLSRLTLEQLVLTKFHASTIGK